MPLSLKQCILLVVLTSFVCALVCFLVHLIPLACTGSPGLQSAESIPPHVRRCVGWQPSNTSLFVDAANLGEIDSA